MLYIVLYKVNIRTVDYQSNEENLIDNNLSSVVAGAPLPSLLDVEIISESPSDITARSLPYSDVKLRLNRTVASSFITALYKL